jgi:hypothetical protein
LKEDVARFPLFCGVENAFDVLRHDSQLLPRRNRSQPFLTGLKCTKRSHCLASTVNKADNYLGVRDK